MGAPVPASIRRVGRRGLPLMLVVASVAAAIGLTSITGRTAGNEAPETPTESTPAIEPPVSRRSTPREEMVRPGEIPRAATRAAAGPTSRAIDAPRAARAIPGEPARGQARVSAAEPSRATPPVAAAVEPAAKPAPAEPSPASGPLVGVGAKLLLGSLLLAGLLYAAARLVRLMPIARLLPGTDGPIKVIGRTHLGPKASLALVQAEGATILVAITGSGIQALHTWNTPGAPALDQSTAKGARAAAPAPALPAQLRALATRLTEGR